MKFGVFFFLIKGREGVGAGVVVAVLQYKIHITIQLYSDVCIPKAWDWVYFEVRVHKGGGRFLQRAVRRLVHLKKKCLFLFMYTKGLYIPRFV